MRQHLVYDLPTRIFHWLFAGLFTVAFVIAKTVDDESSIFGYHSLAGILILFLIAFRILWGLFGTRHARFSGFALSPKDLVQYFQDILAGSKRRWAGHNPASSWAAITMMALAVGTGLSGYLMASGTNTELFEDLHELLANGLLLTIGLHIVGVILHSFRHRDAIGLSMIDGRKSGVANDLTIASSHRFVGVALMASAAALSIHLLKNYDRTTMTLNFLGATLQLGESEGDESGGEDEGMNGDGPESGRDGDQDDD